MLRSILACFAVLAAAMPNLACADEPASLRLNWLAYGFHAPFYLGVAKGLYKAQGIDLTVGEGQGSGRAVQTVAAGSDTFGLADGTSIVSGAARGVPVKAVMGIMNQSPNGVIVRKDAGISTPAGLAGKTLAATTGEAGLMVFPAVMKAQHMPADSIHFLRVDGAAKLVAVLDNRAVGALGGIENQALILEQRGLPVTTMLYSSMGVNSIGLAILTSADTEQTKPDLVRRFVAATRASFELAAKDPDAAIVALLAAKPTLEHDLSMKQLVTALPLMRSLHGPEQPVGWMAPEDWADTLALMKEYQGLQTDMPATAFWTDAYLPK